MLKTHCSVKGKIRRKEGTKLRCAEVTFLWGAMGEWWLFLARYDETPNGDRENSLERELLDSLF